MVFSNYYYDIIYFFFIYIYIYVYILYQYWHFVVSWEWILYGWEGRDFAWTYKMLGYFLYYELIL